ncbi:HVO_A0556 family zinc finger protein [Haloterrigena sp. H1]|uniref:HVO_A0556 family zinc finger protein n=1 Tax=Haloterrigena sp. H1 TaxID=2552943 RepID=UPI0031B861B7
MQSLREQTDQSTKLLELLESTSCSFCDDGLLVRDRYKGHEAVVCSSCWTPGAQVWNSQ